MVTPDSTLPPLLEPNVDGIPASMLDTPRWAPWRAVWNAKKQKYEKIPHRADRPQFGLSNKNAAGWVPFHKAMQVYLENKDKFAGIGYLMTGPHGIVAVDLDHCISGGEIAPWAAEVVAKLDSYTEISPSGNGLRVMVAGELAHDWVNHDVGIEVYGGGDARFVTITGAKLPGSPAYVRAPREGVMDTITTKYRKVQTTAQVEDLHLPDLIDEMLLPAIEDLDLPAHARNFLLDGPEPGRDRSQQLFATSIAMNQAGLPRQMVLSLLEANDHAMEVALDHRRQDYDKAVRYLWKEHCSAGAARAEGFRQLQLDEFEDHGAGEAPAPTGTAADDFDDLGPAVVAERRADPNRGREKFAPLQAGAFVVRATSAAWLIKGALPAAGLGVVYGDSGAGKTFYVLDQVAAVCRGVSWRGLKTKKGRAVYICAEGAAGFQRRLAAYAQFHDVALEDVDMGVITDVPSFMDKADIKALGLQLKKYGKIDLLVVDTYARVMVGGNENDAKDAGLVIAHCELLHRLTGAMVLLVHHSGKDASRGARGSGALRAAADVEVEVIALRGQRVATVTKMKDGEDGKEYAFRLNEVVLGQDEDGDDITSCVVEAKEGSSAAMPRQMKQATPIQLLVLRVLDVASDMAGVVHFAELKRLAVEQIPCDPDKKKDNRHRDVSKAIETLVATGVLVQVEGGNIERANNYT